MKNNIKLKQDLHIHSCFSDGALEPEEIVDRWLDAGYKLISITDHDEIDGSKAAYEYAKGKGIKVLPGVEMDSFDEFGDDIHILGYNIDYENKALRKALFDIKKWRAQRNDQLLAALNEAGYEVSIDELIDVCAGHFIGKPTFAKVLIAKGYVSSIDEAFTEIFEKLDSIKKIKKRTLRSEFVIRLIKEAGGVAVLAHPMEHKRDGEGDEAFYRRIIKLMDKFREYGIDGIECGHPSADLEEQEALKAYAGMYELSMTTGSDFHSDNDTRRY